jgi:hypothetical protein
MSRIYLMPWDDKSPLYLYDNCDYYWRDTLSKSRWIGRIIYDKSRDRYILNYIDKNDKYRGSYLVDMKDIMNMLNTSHKTTIEKVKEALDTVLIEEGYTLLTQDQVDKMSILI